MGVGLSDMGPSGFGGQTRRVSGRRAEGEGVAARLARRIRQQYPLLLIPQDPCGAARVGRIRRAFKLPGGGEHVVKLDPGCGVG